MVSDAVAVGVLTFIGTGSATAVGLWQWQRARVREARASFRTQRAEALGEVWEALTALEESLRTSIVSGDSSPGAGAGRVTQVNLLLLRRSPFLRPDEQEWAQAFAQHVAEVDTLVRAEMMANGHLGEDWWVTSRKQPESSRVAAKVAHQLSIARNKLGERYAAVLRGDSE